jgi:uncharacterized Zn finger protein
VIKLPKLTDADIQAWVGETSMSRGRPYFRNGAVFNPRRSGQTLKAQVEGSLPEPYRVSVTLDDKAISAADCSCPVGSGVCKHVAAGLLTWISDPDEFQEMPDIDAQLGLYSQSELVDLMKRMLDRYPDLERLLERRPPQGQPRQSVKPETIIRQVNAAFRSAGDEWNAGYALSADLLDLVTTGDDYAAQGDWVNAFVVYEAIAREVLERYHEAPDEEGEVLSVVNECVTKLGNCLTQTSDPDRRELILQALVSVERIRNYAGQPYVTPHHLKVAQAAAETRPEAAIRLYLRAVDHAIAGRNRGSYAEAAQHLIRVRELYRRLGQDHVWRELIDTVRQQNRQLRAFQDELNQAKV